MPEPVLCYVSNQWAYFTDAPLTIQHGPGWGHKPYEVHSGPPFEYAKYDLVYQAQLLSRGRKPWKVVRVAFTGSLEPPAANGKRSGLSVEDLNRGVAPWLKTPDEKVKVWAGTTLSEFHNVVLQAGGGGILIQK